MSNYDQKPERFLKNIHPPGTGQNPPLSAYCADFEMGTWRCRPLAFHLAEWLPDYALPEEELHVNHANSLAKITQAAVRVYTSAKFQKRGEAGEIALHAICRDFFGTIPISPHVFYKSASNDVVKAFDMVHARFLPNEPVEIWLGESKLYKQGSRAIAEAIKSIREHIDAGFLSNERLLIGPQIPKSTPRRVAHLWVPRSSQSHRDERGMLLPLFTMPCASAPQSPSSCATHHSPLWNRGTYQANPAR